MTERPLLHRYAHALAEAVGIFVFGGGFFIAGSELLCLDNSFCNGTGKLAVYIFFFLIALVACGLLTSLFARLRHKLTARKRLDIALLATSIFLWALYFYFFV